MILKKSIPLAITLMLTCTNALAQTPIDITVNETYIKSQPYAYIQDGYTMIPVRQLSEILGCSDISWNENERKVTLKTNDTTAILYADSTDAYVNGVHVTMPAKVTITKDRTFVSARFLCDIFNADISWDSKTHTVIIIKDNIEIDEKYIDDTYTREDLFWLAKIVHAEAQGEEENGKIAVANVVLNRTQSEDFPDNIHDVVFDDNYGIQFTPVANGAIYQDPSPESYSAAKQALFGKNVVDNCLYFCNPEISTSQWIFNNRQFYKSIGKHDFYL